MRNLKGRVKNAQSTHTHWKELIFGDQNVASSARPGQYPWEKELRKTLLDYYLQTPGYRPLPPLRLTVNETFWEESKFSD